MKILILSCNTGEGHNSSASALRNAMLKRGIECDKEDTLALVSEFFSRKTSDIYIYSTRINAFQTVYKLGNFVSETNSGLLSGHLKSPVYTTNKLYAKKLYDKVKEGGYDAVVCTHLFPAEALTSLRRNAHLEIPVIFVMTDYTCIPFLNETECDAYVIPHRHLIEEYVEKGLPRQKLYPFGIPVDEDKFSTRIPKVEARKSANEIFGWDESANGRWLLIMGGSMGFGKVGELVDNLLKKIDGNDRIICVCGRNEKLESTLKNEFQDDDRVKITGYTDKVSMLMDASDVLFSKPGGITSTEAAVKNIPFIHMAPIPGVENYNARFFHFHDMSYYTEDLEEETDMALRLCDEPELRNIMLEGQRRNANPHTCEQTIELIESLV